MASSSGSPTASVPDAPKEHVEIEVSVGTKFFYTTPTSKIDYVQLITPSHIEVEAGTTVYIGSNLYVLVKTPESDLHALKQLLKKCDKIHQTTIHLPTGTKVRQSNGIVIALMEDMIVQFKHHSSSIVLPTGTNLQQVDSAVQLKIGTDTNAVLYSKIVADELAQQLAIERELVLMSQCIMLGGKFSMTKPEMYEFIKKASKLQ